jgi:tRNA threonylcarbamoyladenosine biosynthesis protein TsaE
VTEQVTVGGVAGRLVDRGLSWELCELDGQPDQAWLEHAARVAAAGGALDLRVVAEAVGDPWTRLGFTPLAPGTEELTLPVTQVLEGVAQTHTLGRRLATVLRPGDLLVLSGPLGAGKTALTQGIGAGLGVHGAVTSPTFVLARTHRGPLPLVHVDAYRLRDSRHGALALDDLDLETALEDSVVVVEWGQGLVEGLADARLDLTLSRNDDALPGTDAPEVRSLRVRAHGPRWAALSSRRVTSAKRDR